jgi:putative endonuclease
MAYVYILKCSDNTLYTGWTLDLTRRVCEHNGGNKGSKFTRARRPVKLCYVEEFDDKISAMKREAEIKKLTRPKKLELVNAFSNIDKYL